MELELTRMYDLSVKDLNGIDVLNVTDTGMNLRARYDFLVVGQVVRDYQMFVVTPFGE